MNLIKDVFEQAGLQIRENSPIKKGVADEFFRCYPFAKYDIDYLRFMHKIGGIEAFNESMHLVLYGFSLLAPELIYSIEEYLIEDHYLALGNVTFKKSEDPWQGIGYFFCKLDNKPIVHARFHGDDRISNQEFFPICIGFMNLINLAIKCTYESQFTLIAEG